MQVRVRTVADTERSLTRSIEQLGRFLGLVGLIALLLGGTGVASALRAYVGEKIDTIAVLRCLGASASQVVWMFVIEAAGLGLAGALIGVVLGVGAQLVLPHVLGSFIPVDVIPQLEWIPALSGLALGTWVGVLFALGPVLSVRNVAPLQVLRRDDDSAQATSRSAWRDPARVVAALVLALSVVAVCVARADSRVVGLWMSVGIAAAIGATWLSAIVCVRVARRLAQLPWKFIVRHGIANLDRPGNQTRPVVLALGFGAFLLGTLALAQGNLLRQLTSAANASAANLAFFDVQTDQASPLDSVLRSRELPVLSQVPIVPMRIAAYHGHKPVVRARNTDRDTSTRNSEANRPSWAVRREYRSSYRDSSTTSEKIVAGKWWTTPGPDAGGTYEISVEQSLAEELGVGIGDTITWDVQGVRIPTRITSLREVEWTRFEPNFFVVFQSAALREAPQSFVILTRATNDAARARLQRNAVQRFPNVSTIDLTLIENAVGRIIQRVSLAVRFMALFSVVTGVLVLVSAIAASRRQRVRESVLLKTLGATRAQIVRMLFTEYALLGAIGSVAGIILAVGGGWAAVHFIFKTPFSVTPLSLAAVALATMLLTVITGLLAARDVFAETPMAALREV